MITRRTCCGADRPIDGRDRQSDRSRRVNCGIECEKLDQVEAGTKGEQCCGDHCDGNGGAVVG
ncbi:MAG: hypothetical protein WBF02_08000, partial [Xanthobacteraceae bacterium]